MPQSIPQNVLILYTMTGQLLNAQGPNTYEPVYWNVYNTPDLTGQFSGYFGQLQNIAIANTQQISSVTSDVVIPTSPATGDLSGTYPAPIVVGLQGNPLASTAPTSGQLLGWNGTTWTPTAALAFANDLAGSTLSHQYVASLSGSGGAGGSIPINATTLAFAKDQASPSILQSNKTTDTSTQTLLIKAQDALSSAVVHTLGGSLTLQSGAPTATGVAGNVLVNIPASVSGQSGQFIVSIGGPTQQITQTNLLTTISTPLQFTSLGGSGISMVQTDNFGNLSAFNPAMGGDLTGTFPNPTVVQLTGSSGVVTIPKTNSFLLLHNSQTTDLATVNMTLHAQSAFALASSNKTGGSLNLQAGAGASGGQAGDVLVTIPASGGLGLSGHFNVTIGSTSHLVVSDTLCEINPAVRLDNLAGSGSALVQTDNSGNLTVLSTTMGGDLSGTFPNPSVVSITGTAGNVNIAAAQTTLDNGSAIPIISGVKGVQTTTTSPVTALTFAHADNTAVDWVVTFVGRNHANNGDYYRADFTFTSQRFGGAAPTLNPSSPVAINIRSVGGGSVYLPTVTISSNNILLNAVGASATTVDWTVTYQAQVRG